MLRRVLPWRFRQYLAQRQNMFAYVLLFMQELITPFSIAAGKVPCVQP